MHPQREQAGHFARRTFLKAGSISAGGLLLPQLLQAEDRVRSHEPTASPASCCTCSVVLRSMKPLI